jgi:preprotein translocase subunit SecE
MGKMKERGKKIKTFFGEVKKEAKNITWPNKNELMSYTIAVLVAVALLSVLIGIEDKLISTFMSWVIR